MIWEQKSTKKNNEMSSQLLDRLKPFSTCDLSDALAALPDLSPVGMIPDVIPYGPSEKIIGLAYTTEFVLATENTPKPKVNHVDTCPSGSILVIKSPRLAPNAVWGGLMTARALQVGCRGVIVEGRIRDVSEIQEMKFPVWAKGLSTMGAAPISKVGKVGEPVTLASDTPWPVVVQTGDVIVADEDGVVRIPLDAIDRIVEYCEWRVDCDQKCMADIKAGKTIVETFAKHRTRK
jgi:regulator of RNase E activity RraA